MDAALDEERREGGQGDKFARDEAIGYVDSPLCSSDRKNMILCCFRGVGIRDVDEIFDDILSGHGGGTLVKTPSGANDEGRTFSEDLKSR